MGLLDLFRPKWKHSDVDVRAEAVRQLDEGDLNLLRQIAREDRDARVRRIAIKRIEDPQVLLDIAQRDTDDGLRRAAQERADQLLLDRALGEDETRAQEALSHLGRERTLLEVVRRGALASVRRAALDRVRDERMLGEVVQKGDDPELRLAALSRIADPAVLREVAEGAPNKELGLQAVARIDDPVALAELVQRGKNKAVRNAARDRLKPAPVAQIRVTTTQAEEALEKRRRVQMQNLCQRADHAAAQADQARAFAEVEALQKAWAELGVGLAEDPLARRFHAACEKVRDRQHVAEKRAREQEQRREQEAAREGRAREEAAVRAALCERVDALAGATIPAGLEEARAAWAALPRPEALSAESRSELDRRFSGAVKAASRRHEQALSREAQRGELESLLGEIERLAAERESGPTRRLPGLLRRFRELGAGLAPDDPLTARFARIEEAQESRRAEDAAQLRVEAEARLGQIDALSARLEALAEGSDRKRMEGALKDARDDRALFNGLAVDRERAEAARARLRTARDRVIARQTELRDEDDWKRWANLPKLELIVSRVEALGETTDLKEAQEEMNLARQLWKDLGPPPREKADALWARFQAGADAVHARVRAHYVVQDEQRGENLKKKEALCEQAEALRESSEWKETAETLKRLQGEWKAIGPVPKESTDAVWRRFRTACDHFFERRNQHQGTVTEERQANQKKKEALCARAEALRSSQDFKDTADEFKRLQGEWKEIGPVPKDQADALWARFRTACDSFFAARKLYFDQMDEERQRNLVQKEALCTEIEALCTGEDLGEQEAVEHVRRLSAAWKDIGPVPKEKSEPLWTRFREGCDRLLLKRWEPAPPEEGVARFVNRLPLGNLAERLGLSSPGVAGEGDGGKGAV